MKEDPGFLLSLSAEAVKFFHDYSLSSSESAVHKGLNLHPVFAQHRIGLAATSLAIGEDRAIDPLADCRHGNPLYH